MDIPTVIIEEHHEAYIVWCYAIQNGIIAETENTLIHVDEHSDMAVPRLNLSLNELNGDLDKIKKFTYNELGIGSFIVPAIYKGIFNSIYWIKIYPPKVISEKMFIRSYNKGGKKLIKGHLKESNKNEDRKDYNYYLSSLENIQDLHCSNVILDIDIDYFSSVTRPNDEQEIYIEITEKEYSNFINNKYHRLNFYCQRIEAGKKDDKFYYVLNNYNEIYPDKLTVEPKEIQKRIDHFIKLLGKIQIEPSLIILCRSIFSGYTPRNQASFIESELISKLKQLYHIDLLHINDI
jgi:hypothetical protein